MNSIKRGSVATPQAALGLPVDDPDPWVCADRLRKKIQEVDPLSLAWVLVDRGGIIYFEESQRTALLLGGMDLCSSMIRESLRHSVTSEYP